MDMDDPIDGPRHPDRTFAALATACVAYAIMQSLVTPALPAIQRNFGADETGVAWVFTGFLLAASVATPIVGRLGDMFGKDRWLRIVLVAYAAGTVLAALAPSLGVLIVARGLQGIAAGVFPLAYGIVRDELPRERVAGAIGFLTGIVGLGAGIGVVLAGPIVDGLGWRWLFWLPLAPIAVALAMSWRWVPPSPVRVPGRVNWPAAALMVAGLATVLLAVSETASWGWGSRRTLALLAAGLALVGAWVAVELRSAEPLVDMRMMRLPAVWRLNLVTLLLGAAMYTAFLLIPQFVQVPERAGFGFGASTTGGGLVLLPSTLATLACSMLAGRVARRFGGRASLVVGAVLGGAGFLLLLAANETLAPVYVASTLIGAGVGFSFAAMGMLVVTAVPPHQTSVAAGMNAVLRTLGGAVGAQVGATLVAASVVAGLPRLGGFEAVFATMAGVIAVGTAVALTIPRRPRAAAMAPEAGGLAVQEA